MSAAKAPMAEAKTSEELNAKPGELAQLIDKVSSSLAALKRRKENLTAERGSLVVPARTGRDDAKKRLSDVDTQLAAVNAEIEDDESALVELRNRLQRANDLLAIEAWEAARNRVREKIEARLKSGAGKRIQRLARDLAAALDAAKEDDERLIAEMKDFEPQLYGNVANQMREFAVYRRTGVAFDLLKQLEIESRYFYAAQPREHDLAAADSRFYGRAMDALDSLELILT